MKHRIQAGHLLFKPHTSSNLDTLDLFNMLDLILEIDAFVYYAAGQISVSVYASVCLSVSLCLSFLLSFSLLFLYLSISLSISLILPFSPSAFLYLYISGYRFFLFDTICCNLSMSLRLSVLLSISFNIILPIYAILFAAFIFSSPCPLNRALNLQNRYLRLKCRHKPT